MMINVDVYEASQVFNGRSGAINAATIYDDHQIVFAVHLADDLITAGQKFKRFGAAVNTKWGDVVFACGFKQPIHAEQRSNRVTIGRDVGGEQDALGGGD